MDRELISKKELLELTGISYGQLYRWKRKQLIPEEWFIRKSAFTGQETFFPKELILARIERIIDMKDDLSLDELAGKLSPELENIHVRKIDCLKRNIVSEVVLKRYAGEERDDALLSFESMLFLYVTDKLLQAGEMSLDEGALLQQTLREHFAKFAGKGCDLLFFRKMGVSAFALLAVPGEVYFESGVKLVVRLSLAECIEELKIRLS